MPETGHGGHEDRDQDVTVLKSKHSVKECNQMMQIVRSFRQKNFIIDFYQETRLGNSISWNWLLES